MRQLTVNQVEEELMESLIDLQQVLRNQRLECTDEQATVLLKNYHKIQEEVLMLLGPDYSFNIPGGKLPC